MELNATLITVQGALMRVCKSTGGLSKIKYKGGGTSTLITSKKIIISYL